MKLNETNNGEGFRSPLLFVCGNNAEPLFITYYHLFALYNKKIPISYHVFTRIITSSDSPTGYLTSKPGSVGKTYAFGSFFVVQVGHCAEFVRNISLVWTMLDNVG